MCGTAEAEPAAGVRQRAESRQQAQLLVGAGVFIAFAFIA